MHSLSDGELSRNSTEERFIGEQQTHQELRKKDLQYIFNLV